jgi:chromosomal replication initiation ATPase DnaA
MLTRTKSQREKIKKNTNIADTAARSLKLNTKKSQVNVEDIIGKKSLVENAITIDLIGKVLNEIIID